MTLWTTVETALEVDVGDLAAVRTLDGQGHSETMSGVDHYEVDADGARRRDGSPTRLRPSAGTAG